MTPVTPLHRARAIVIERVPDQLIIGTRQAFKEQCLTHLEAGKDLIVDFHEARYLDSSGLGVLVTLSKKFQERGRRLVVCGLNDDLLTLWELTRMDVILRPYRDTQEAEQALQAA